MFYTVLIPLVFLLLEALLIRYALKREKKDPEFAIKMDKFRKRTLKFIPPKHVRENILYLIIVAILIYLFIYGTGYEYDGNDF